MRHKLAVSEEPEAALLRVRIATALQQNGHQNKMLVLCKMALEPLGTLYTI